MTVRAELAAPAEPRRRWHWLTNDRADFMDAIAADPDLAAPAKVAAYALVRRCDYRTLTVQASVQTIASSVGVSPRRMQEALKALESRGWISRKDGGSRANLYSLHIERDTIDRTEASEQTARFVRTEASAQHKAFVETEASEQTERENKAPDQSVRTLSVSCADGFGHLYGRKRPTITVETVTDGGARPARKPPESDSDPFVERYEEELSKSESLHREEDCSPEARSPSLDLEFEEVAPGQWEDDGWPPAPLDQLEDDLPF